MSRVKRIVVLVVVGILIGTPVLKTPYHEEGVGTIEKSYSLVTSLLADIQEGQFLTPQIILNNIMEVI